MTPTPEQAPEQTDVAIIGAGPVGLFAIFQCGMLNMRCHVFDALEAPGGQLTALYPEKPIYDIPGYPEIMAWNLVEHLTEQAAPFQPVYHLGQQVSGLSETGDGGWRVTGADGTVVDAKAVILAAGAGAFGPKRPPLQGLESYEGSSVFYLVTRREDFRDKTIVIAGGGDSAVDWAVSLAEVARKVMVVHRRPRFRAQPGMVERLQALAKTDKVELVIPFQLDALDGDGDTLSAVLVRDLDDNVRRLEADILLPFFGLSMDLGPIRDWGLEAEQSHLLVDPASCQTNRAGIYAIGDVATYPGKLKLILCGFSEAAMAAHHAFGLVHPDEALHFEYSTSKGRPGEG